MPENLEVLSFEATWRLLHELQVHQIELEMQNDELRRTQVELEASRARYFDLYDLAPVGYCTLSETGLILEANLTAARLLGVERKQLVRRPLTRFIVPGDQDIYYRHRKQLLKTGEPQACEVRMVKNDGTVFWVHLASTVAQAPSASSGQAPSTSSEQDTDGAPGFRVMLSDITERKFQEDERELTARLIVLINTPGDFRERMLDLTASLQGWSGCEAVGIRLRAGDDYPYYGTRGFPPAFVHLENRLCAYGPDGKILRDGAGNSVLECMCGNILCGRFDPAEPFFTTHGSFWTNSTTALLASTTEADRLARTRNRCNTEGYESVALIPLRTGHQVLGLLQFNDHRPDRFTPGLIAHFERMADSLAIALSRRQAEEALADKSEELARSNRELEQFAYVASHDLQEPLRMVSSYLQLLERNYKGKLDSDADEFIGYAVDGASRMRQLIDDLLAYSRVSTHGNERVPTDCNAVLDHVLANLQIAIRDSQASVTHEPLPTVQGDGAQLEQLFQNLVANAIKFHGDQPPEVHIAARREGREWVFSVRDNGIGIDPKYFERIFVLFQRLHTREEYPGTGIGLAVAKRVVERHGGRMWVESEPGQGATFFFALPAEDR